MIFYVCLALAVFVTISGVVACTRRLNLFGRLEQPVHAVLAVSLINTCILYFPWFLYSWQPEIKDFKHDLLIVPFMIVRLMQTVSMDADYESAIEIAYLAQASGVSEAFLQFYSVVLSYVSVMVPLSGILTVAGIFGNRIGYRLATGRLSGKDRMFVFNGAGVKNLELAQSILESEGRKAKQCSFLFCNERDPGDSAKKQIARLKGWYSAEHPSLLLRTVTYRRSRSIEFFLLEDEERNFNDVMGILKAADVLSRNDRSRPDAGGRQASGSRGQRPEADRMQTACGRKDHWSEADRVKVHLLLESDQLDNILDAQDKHGIFVRIMNTDRMRVQELFKRWPLFSGLQAAGTETAGTETGHAAGAQMRQAVGASAARKPVSLMIIGGGSVAENALYTSLWMGQLTSTALKIYYVGEDADEIRDRMYMTCPALFDPSLSGGVSYDLEFEDLMNREQLRLHEREFPDTNYILIACGDDEKNVRTAMWVRTWIARQKPESEHQPFIAVCVKDSRQARRADGLCIQESRESYDFHIFGTDSRLFTAENILHSNLDRILYNVQLSYSLDDEDAVPTAAQKDQAWMELNKSVYNFRSSEASAQYIVNRLYDAGAIEESMKREFAGDGAGTAGTGTDAAVVAVPGAGASAAGAARADMAGTSRKYSGYEQAVYWAEAVQAAETEGDRTRIGRIVSVYEEVIREPGALDLLAQTEHRRWLAYMAVKGWIPMPVEDLRKRVGAGPGGHKDYLRLRHAAMVPWEELDEVSDIITDGKDRDKLKESDRRVVRNVRKYIG